MKAIKREPCPSIHELSRDELIQLARSSGRATELDILRAQRDVAVLRWREAGRLLFVAMRVPDRFKYGTPEYDSAVKTCQSLERQNNRLWKRIERLDDQIDLRLFTPPIGRRSE